MTAKKKVLSKKPPIRCPYNPEECQVKFQDILRHMEELEAKVDALPNGSKLDIILSLVEGTSERITTMGPQVVVIGQRVDEALRLNDATNHAIEEMKKWLASVEAKIAGKEIVQAIESRVVELEKLVEDTGE